MPLIVQRQEYGREQFKVYEDRRYIGRVYQTPRGDWFWSVDLLLMEGKESIDGRMATRQEALTQLRAAWKHVERRGHPTATGARPSPRWPRR